MMYSLGIMSGTSLDGLDISLIKSDGEKKIFPIYNITYSYSQEFKNEINFFIKYINTIDPKKIKVLKEFKLLERKVNHFLLEKINLFFNAFELSSELINIVGLHGQTVFHCPKNKLSIQMGCAEFLARSLKIPCVSNFRNADILAGGQGAPLVPIFHKAIFKKKKKFNLAVVNIGGISNITWLGKKDRILSSDIGPGNTLIDQFCEKKFNVPFDKNGFFSSKGNVNEKLLDSWMKYPFIKKQIPKSFDNFFFKLDNFFKSEEINNYDFIATLTKFSSNLIINSEIYFEEEIDKWVICGGGAKNKTILKNLKDSLKKVITSDQLGWNSNFIESQAFAYLAVRKKKNYFSSFPETTGVKEPTVCGDIFEP